jgi:hypothetical protein
MSRLVGKIGTAVKTVRQENIACHLGHSCVRLGRSGLEQRCEPTMSRHMQLVVRVQRGINASGDRH